MGVRVCCLHFKRAEKENLRRLFVLTVTFCVNQCRPAEATLEQCDSSTTQFLLFSAVTERSAVTSLSPLRTSKTKCLFSYIFSTKYVFIYFFHIQMLEIMGQWQKYGVYFIVASWSNNH